MAVPLGIDAATGTLSFGEICLTPNHAQEAALALIAPLMPSFNFGHRNSAGLSIIFADRPAHAHLVFTDGKLLHATLHLRESDRWLIGEEAEHVATIFEQALLRDHGIALKDYHAYFPWGTVYSNPFLILGAPAMGPHSGVYYGPGYYECR